MLSLYQHISDFLCLLQKRQRSLQRDPEGVIDSSPSSLNYANALLRFQIQRLGDCPLPLQVAVIGPTQSGKSSLVNLIVGGAAAAASPLAGHTRYAQGFTSGDLTGPAMACLDRMLSNWRRVSGEVDPALSGEIFSVQQVAGGHAFTNRPVLVWDTPDFDSLSSREYRETVPEICAMADLIVLVVCREKYADRSVWQMLRVISRMDIPLFVCLNKTLPGEQSTLLASMQQRLQEASVSCSGMLALPFVSTSDLGLEETEEADKVRNRIAGLLPALPSPRPGRLLYEFLTAHWGEWTGGVQLEISAAERWNRMVHAGLEESLALYQRDYLDNPRVFDTLQRAVIQLLQLLEIPGIAPALTRIRSVVTWPVRKLQDLLSDKLQHGRRNDPGAKEEKILEDALTHLIVNLRNQAARKFPVSQDAPGFPWWQGLLGLLDRREAEIRGAAHSAIADYQADFEHEIEAAGRRLYQHLQAHPAALNSLRAARATTDLAAVVLAIKTGGIGVNDLILTPAMLSVTSLLAESAVGRYMKQVGGELRERQLKLVDRALFHGVLEERLLELPQNIPDSQCLQIPRELIEQAAVALSTLRSTPREAING